MEVLVRALTKQAALGVTPRRQLPGAEAEGSLGPLARRLQSLRSLATKQAGPYREPATTSSTATALPVVLHGGAEGAWVVLDKDRAHWLDGVPADAAPEPAALLGAAKSTRTYAYEALSGLALTWNGPSPILVAADRTGTRWKQPIAEADVRPLQQALDAVEGRLGSATPVSSPVALGPIVVLIATLAAWSYARGSAVLLIPLALVLLVRPSSATAGAIGGAAFFDAARRLFQYASIWDFESPLESFRAGIGPGPCVALTALAMLSLAWARRRATQPEGGGKAGVVWVPLVVLALLATNLAGGLQYSELADTLPTTATFLPVITNGRAILEVNQTVGLRHAPDRGRSTVFALGLGAPVPLVTAGSISCSAGPNRASGFVCWSRGVRPGALWGVSGEPARARPIGAVDGYISSAALTSEGVIVVSSGSNVLLVHRNGAASRVTKLTTLPAAGWAVRVAGRTVAVIELTEERRGFVRFIELPPAAELSRLPSLVSRGASMPPDPE